MTVLWVAMGCWLVSLALIVALRARATSRRTTQLRRPMRPAQLRALKMHAGTARASLVALEPRR